MHPDILMMFDKTPDAIPIFEALENRIIETFHPEKIKIGKTQVTYSNKYGFVYLWPPYRKFKNRPKNYVGVTFGLPYKREHPRIVESVEPYPNRWTHHVLIEHEHEVDDELFDWIQESYDFSMGK